MKLSAQSHASIVSSLQEAIDKFIADGEKTVVTDIHLQPKQDSGELVLFNDDDEELSRPAHRKAPTKWLGPWMPALPCTAKTPRFRGRFGRQNWIKTPVGVPGLRQFFKRLL